MSYPKSEYKLIGFEKAKAKGKKYSAIIQNRQTKKQKRMNFGALGYEHYKDKTPLKLYSNLDHNDKNRRDSYQARHNTHRIDESEYSPAYFSFKYLW